MVAGSHHLALGANELEGRARRPPDCQLALLFTTLPTLTIASGMAAIGTVVFASAGRSADRAFLLVAYEVVEIRWEGEEVEYITNMRMYTSIPCQFKSGKQ